MKGKVIFVGAGPGADDLITVRGARVIAEADIVICLLENGSAVGDVLFAQGAAAAMQPGALVVDMLASSGHAHSPLWQRIFWSVSIGVVSVSAPSSVDALFARADAALYRAKQAGRNRVMKAGAAIA